MIYKAKMQRTMLLFFLILITWDILLNRDYPEIYFFLIPLSLFTLATLFVNFKFRIDDEFLTFKIRFLTLTIYKKEVHHQQIKHMKCKRTGWARKCVIVQNNQGFNFRITNFNSEKVYIDLIDFANKYEIPISKTKDYLILEKLK